jgi:AraC family transcriptional regulator
VSASIATGDFVSWDGGCLFISRRAAAVTPYHAHYATQIAFGSEHGIRFRASDRDPWATYEGVVIASRQPHSMDSMHVSYCAVLFVEPETREGHALHERFSETGITALPPGAIGAVGTALFSAWQDQRSIEAVTAAARRVVRELTGGVEPLVATDERILRTTSHIRSHLDADLTLDGLADIACLSPSRFRHLFIEETGMKIRPYILWRRFLYVWELLASGASLSSAAHAAGFADAAHLTRTSVRMFGFPPSAVQFGGPLRREAERASAVSSASAHYPAPPTDRSQPFRSKA